jgi:hypothetical protein
MSRLDRLKEQHPELNISLIDMLVKVDPTSTYKYTEFLIKMIKEMFIDDDASDIGLNIGIDILGWDNVDSLNEFEIHSRAGRIKNSDISSYKNWKQIKNSVKDAEEVVKQKEAEKQINKLYDDSEWLVVIPLSFESSKVYGMGTKWCTTQENHWNDYISNYKMIYIINKLSNEKYAISRDKRSDSKILAWLSDDNASIDISPQLQLPLVNYVMARVFQYQEDNEMANAYMRNFEQGIAVLENNLTAPNSNRQIIMSGGLVLNGPQNTAYGWSDGPGIQVMPGSPNPIAFGW